MPLSVTMVAATEVREDIFSILDVCSTRDYLASSPEHLTEFAGRACYRSFDRPNPATAATDDYVRVNILGKGHESVLEHASATFYVTGVSRSLTHELIRHRHLSYSELSQRFVDVSDTRYVIPPALRDAQLQWAIDKGAETPTVESIEDYFQSSAFFDDTREAYGETVELFEEFAPSLTRKQRREAARSVMPNATETEIVVTGNFRAWRDVLKLRGSLHADAEIREWAVETFVQLRQHSPAIFSDMDLNTDERGRVHIVTAG